MNRPIPINVDLIAKITGLLTCGTQPEEYLENKSREKEIVEIVKVRFDTNKGNCGIVIKDINDFATRFSSKLMACKFLRKCHKYEFLAKVFIATT